MSLVSLGFYFFTMLMFVVFPTPTSPPTHLPPSPNLKYSCALGNALSMKRSKKKKRWYHDDTNKYINVNIHTAVHN